MKYTIKKQKKFPAWHMAVLSLAVLLFSACENSLQTNGSLDHDSSDMEKFLHVDPTKAPELQELEQALKIGAEAMKKAVQNPRFLAEVYTSIKFYEEQAHDHNLNRFTAVSFAELESKDALHRIDGATKLSPSESSRIFTGTLQDVDRAIRQQKQRHPDLHKFLIEDLANLYMPNFEIWDGKEIPTIAWHPLDEEEESGLGFEPVFDSGKRSVVTGWKEVVVNEEYTKSRPVLIVMPGKSFSYAPATMEATISPTGETTLRYDKEALKESKRDHDEESVQKAKNSSNQDYYAPCDESQYCNEKMYVQLGWIRLKHYPCGTFCSGRTIRFNQQRAYEPFPSAKIVVDSNNDPRHYVPRKKRGDWRYVYETFDGGWADWHLAKPMTLSIERGNPYPALLKGTFRLIEVVVGGNPDAGQIVNLVYETYEDMRAAKKKRDVFYNGILHRSTFKAYNTSDMGHGTRGGFRVYKASNNDGGYIQYTLPHSVAPYH